MQDLAFGDGHRRRCRRAYPNPALPSPSPCPLSIRPVAGPASAGEQLATGFHRIRLPYYVAARNTRRKTDFGFRGRARLLGMRALLFFFAFAAAAQNWPSFRGPSASGVADKQKLPVSWDSARRTHILWKTRIPGLAHSSPIVCADRVFVTTAVSSLADASFKLGLYGEGTASDDLSVHQWKLICLDRKTGQIVWERIAYEGAPREK